MMHPPTRRDIAQDAWATTKWTIVVLFAAAVFMAMAVEFIDSYSTESRTKKEARVVADGDVCTNPEKRKMGGETANRVCAEHEHIASRRVIWMRALVASFRQAGASLYYMLPMSRYCDNGACAFTFVAGLNNGMQNMWWYASLCVVALAVIYAIIRAITSCLKLQRDVQYRSVYGEQEKLNVHSDPPPTHSPQAQAQAQTPPHDPQHTTPSSASK